MTSAAVLLLADGRFPSGAHAHSHGVEAAVGVGDVRTLDDLETYLRRRLDTVGRVDAAFAATAHAADADCASLDLEYAARTMSPVLRAASRSLGRQLLRAAEQIWRSSRYATLRSVDPSPFHPIAFGVVAAAAGVTSVDAARCNLHHLAGGITTAAVRLLGLDPYAVTALLARTAPHVDELALEAANAACGPIDRLPARVDPIADILAEHHATWEVRLFAS